MGDREHGGPYRVTVDDAGDVVERLVAGQVQLHLRRGRSAVGGVHDRAVRVDHHQVVQRHVGVVDRRRGDHQVAVFAAGRDVAGGALDQPAAQHVLGRRQYRGLGVGDELTVLAPPG